MIEARYWFFVAGEIKHLETAEKEDETWWCVSRKCNPGDKALLYKKLAGVICYFEILENLKPEFFCNMYGMDTAKVRILKVFDPPIAAKELKTIGHIKDEPFIRKNFQGKTFLIDRDTSAKAILEFKRQKELSRGFLTASEKGGRPFQWSKDLVIDYYTKVKKELERPDLIGGKDLLALGMSRGPEIGGILQKVREAQDVVIVRSREEALALAQEMRSAEEGTLRGGI